MNVDYTTRTVAHSCGNSFTHVWQEQTPTEIEWRELNEKLNNFSVTPQEVMRWHRMFNPLKDHHEQGSCHLFSAIESLPNAMGILVAYACGFNPQEYGTQDAREYFRRNGTMESHLQLLRVPFSAETPFNAIATADLPSLILDTIAELEHDELGMTTEQISYLLFAAEIAKDVSDIPVTTLPNVSEFLAGVPSGERERYRRVAYTLFSAVASVVDHKVDPTTHEKQMRLSALEYIIGMINTDAIIVQTLHDYYGELYALSDVDLVHECGTNSPVYANTGFTEFDKNIRSLDTVLQARNVYLLEFIEYIKESLTDKQTGLVNILTKAQFKGTVHEAMWLIDSIMRQFIVPDESVLVSKSLTRQDKNLMAKKPTVKSSYDMSVSKVIQNDKMLNGSSRIQLKSSQIGVARAGYVDEVTVAAESIFNDANPGRIVGKLNAYKRIIAGEMTQQQAYDLYQRYALESVQQFFGD